MSPYPDHLRKMAEEAGRRLLTEHPDTPGEVLRELVFHVYLEGLPALQQLERKAIEFAQGHEETLYGDLFHCYYHVYNALVLWDLLRDSKADTLDSVREALDALRSHQPDPTAAEQTLAKLQQRLLGRVPAPKLPGLNEDA